MDFADLKMLVQSSLKNVNKPNRTHLGAIFGPRAMRLQPLVYVFVSLTQRLSHLLS